MTQEIEAKPHHLIKTLFRTWLPPLFNREFGFKVQHHELDNIFGDAIKEWRTCKFFYVNYSMDDPYKPSLIRRLRWMIQRR